jgi:hypothetical protein
MRFNHAFLPAFLLLSETACSAAKTITLRSNGIVSGRNGLNEIFKRTATEALDGTLVLREAFPQQSSNSVTVPVSPSSGGNVSAACLQAVSGFDNATDSAGIVACYALPYLNTTTGMFSAELHLYSMSPPSGSFADIPQKDILFTMAYPAASVSSLTKRMSRGSGLEQRDSISANTPVQLQTSTFIGALDTSLQLDKLNRYVGQA